MEPTSPAARPTNPSPAQLFRADVLGGLRMVGKQLPCKYFYDEVGSRLFERICELEEYYLTRTELEIMEAHAPEMAGALGPRCAVIEYGTGSGVKARLLFHRLADAAAYVPVDLASGALREAARAFADEYPGLAVRPVCADFSRPFQLPDLPFPAARRVVYFPGSTIGNFPPEDAIALLRQTAQLVGSGGGLLLGADLKKDPAVLHAAYNDRDGVTAAFNRNLLTRINRELGADFPVDEFWHHAFYEPTAGRIEMHLISRRDVVVHVADEEFFLAESEAVRTEYSYKYSPRDLTALADAGGFTLGQLWTDADRRFAVAYLVAA